MAFDLWTADQEAAALAFCVRYQGTPHGARRNQPGVAIDCVRFVAGALQAAGMLPSFTWPQYPQSIGIGQPTNWMGEAILRHTRSHSIEPARWHPATGDIGIFRVGRVSNHIGVTIAGRFWHVTVGRPCHHCSPETVRGHLQEIIRLDAPGFTVHPSPQQIA